MFIDSLPEAPPGQGYTKRYDYNANGQLIYEGWAKTALNASVNAAVWTIRAYTYTGNNLTFSGYANGTTAENQIWANRATLTYQ
jgi:trans-2-enoyl-CoA reductase